MPQSYRVSKDSDSRTSSAKHSSSKHSSSKHSSSKHSVLLVCDYSLSYLGGAQIAFMRQIEALLGEGWSVIVLAPGAKKALSHIGTPLLTIIEPKVLYNLPGVDLPVIGAKKGLEKRLNSLLAAGRIEGIIVHSEFAMASVALRAAKYNLVPVLQTVHTFFWRTRRFLGVFAPLVTTFHVRLTGLPKNPRFRGSTRINNALRSMTLRFADRVDAVISPSKHQAEQLSEAGLKNVHPLSNVLQKLDDKCLPVGRDTTDVASDIGRADAASANTMKIVWAGRFAPEKRLEVALAAMKLIAESSQGVAVELHVAGGSLPKSVMKHNTDSVKVIDHGRIPNFEVTELVCKSDLVLITSLGFDNQPMIALEGFAKHRPVLVTDPVLKKEFGEAAILSVNPEAEGLAETIINLAQKPHLLRESGMAAAEYTKERGASKHVAGLRELLATARHMKVN